MAIIKVNKRRPLRKRGNMVKTCSSLSIPSSTLCEKCNHNQGKINTRAIRQRVVSVRVVRKSSFGKYAYLYQEDRELDNAIFTMKKILKETD